MRRVGNLAIVASVLAAIWPAAQAESVSAASLQDLRIRLVDLDPADLGLPFVSFDGNARSTALAYFSVGPGANTDWGGPSDSTFGAVSAAGEYFGTGGMGAVAGDPLGAGATFGATGYATPQYTGVGSADVQYDLGPNLLTLSAHTEIVFGATAFSSWALDSPLGSASNVFMLEVGAPGLPSSGGGFASIDDNSFQRPGGALSASHRFDLSAVFANDSDAAVTASYSIYAGTIVSDALVPPTSSVPEPGAAALAATGLGVVLLSTARRRRDGAASCAVSGLRRGGGAARRCPARRGRPASARPARARAPR